MDTVVNVGGGLMWEAKIHASEELISTPAGTLVLVKV